ncbi:MAG: D-sedoheptulose 7-phosphate isomerase [Bacteroidia bacterium]|nr:D-sedoheptulose 7-phosphate isomerase [Bacteroidia bacterium]MCX7652162.1 D-sedoheptulose 7-phosphate isomerase [Bacteroidia bacterium]MDW8416889.1 D-sedoheptulose 7-phosphate isomerase [Bacteroidia bacterium]
MVRAVIQRAFSDSLAVKQAILSSESYLQLIEQIAQTIIKTFQSGGRLFFCGNGGSAADAQHLAAEFTGRYYKDRAPLPAEALHVNTSFLTAVANDYSYEETFSRLLRGWGRPGDLLWAMSTSGNSPNILKAIDTAREIGMLTIGLTGATGGKMVGRCDYLLQVPSTDTPRIQEAHMLVGHIICEIVEKALF